MLKYSATGQDSRAIRERWYVLLDVSFKYCSLKRDDNNVRALFVSLGCQPRSASLVRGGLWNTRKAPQHDRAKLAIYQILIGCLLMDHIIVSWIIRPDKLQ